MKTTAIPLILLLIACAATSRGQSYYPTNVVPVPVAYRPVAIGYYDPGYGWQEARWRSAAAVIEAQAHWNLYTSQALIHREQARRLAMENNQRKIEIHNDIKQAYQARLAAQWTARRELAAQARAARPAAPKPAEVAVLNPATGEIAWPVALQADEFVVDRTALEDRLAHYRSAGAEPQDRALLRLCVQAMKDKLIRNLREVPATEYLEAKRFLAACDSHLLLDKPAPAHVQLTGTPNY